jgi:hypothetical protein
MEQDSKVIVGLPAVEEPELPALPEEEEIPLPEVLRAPVPHSPIWVPSPSPWPLETAVAPGLVGVDVVIPPLFDQEGEVDLDEFSLDDIHNILQIHLGGNGDSEIDGDNHLGVMPGVDGTLQLDGVLVGYGWDDNDDDDDDGKNDELRYVEGIPHHIPIAPPPNPAPEETEEEFVFGAASRGVGSTSNTRNMQGAGNATPSSRQMTGTFGPHQLDYRLNEPSIVTSWAQESFVEISVPVPGRASGSNNSRVQNES